MKPDDPENPLETGDDRPAFPYYLIWDELRPNWVGMDVLAAAKDDFDRRFRAARFLKTSSIPSLDISDFVDLLHPLKLPKDAAERLSSELYLIAGYFLRPKQAAAWEADVASARKGLKKLVKTAAETRLALDMVTAHAFAVMRLMLPAEPGAMDPHREIETDLLWRQLHDLGLVAQRFLDGTAPAGSGRRKEIIRDNALKLAVERIQQATSTKIKTLREAKGRPSPHFAGEAGDVLRSFFKLISPKQDEAALVGVLESLRRVKQIDE